MTRPGPGWLARLRPPGGVPDEPECRLWWAVLRQAARDLRGSHDSDARDAHEFLTTTGRWLLVALFGERLVDIDREIKFLSRKREWACGHNREPRTEQQRP